MNLISLDDFKSLYALSFVVLSLIIISPTVAMFFPPSKGARFSELWVLNEERKMEGYPFNVVANTTYKVRVGVSNHIGTSAHYLIYVKFKNQSATLPNATSAEPSPTPPLMEYRFFLEENGNWETLAAFGFPTVSRFGNYCRVESVEIDGRIFIVEQNSMWDSLSNGFFYQMFFELWLYNMASKRFEYNNRFVGFWMNMTA